MFSKLQKSIDFATDKFIIFMSRNIFNPILGLIVTIVIFESLYRFSDKSLEFRVCVYMYALIILSTYIKHNLDQVKKTYTKKKSEMTTRVNILASICSSIFFFAIVYFYMYSCNNNHFSGNLGNDLISNLISFTYFSFTTFLTVGYGDIHAVTNIARVMVIIEMIYAFSVGILILSSFDEIKKDYKSKHKSE